MEGARIFANTSETGMFWRLPPRERPSGSRGVVCIGACAVSRRRRAQARRASAARAAGGACGRVTRPTA
eukprot:461988-Pleurochrysis_carterae.AAC.1